MVDEEDFDEDGEYEPTEEEKAYAERLYKLAERYPTFLLLTQALRRHRRFQRLTQLGAPAEILEKEKGMREHALDVLANAFPYDADGFGYHLQDVLNTLIAELRRPHGQGGTDA